MNASLVIVIITWVCNSVHQLLWVSKRYLNCLLLFGTNNCCEYQWHTTKGILHLNGWTIASIVIYFRIILFWLHNMDLTCWWELMINFGYKSGVELLILLKNHTIIFQQHPSQYIFIACTQKYISTFYDTLIILYPFIVVWVG